MKLSKDEKIFIYCALNATIDQYSYKNIKDHPVTYGKFNLLLDKFKKEINKCQ